MKSAIWLIFGLAALTACGSPAIPRPTTADVSRGALSFPDLTLDELSHGRSLYVSRCGSCHALKAPAELSAGRWQEEVSEMRSKNGVKLSDEEAQAIVRYLSVAATPG
jgi:mono/diheme cytochrome c family protein